MARQELRQNLGSVAAVVVLLLGYSLNTFKSVSRALIDIFVSLHAYDIYQCVFMYRLSYHSLYVYLSTLFAMRARR